MGTTIADDEHLLLAILKETDGIAFEVINSNNLDYDSVVELIKDDSEEEEVVQPKLKDKKSKSKTPALDHFSRNITKMAEMEN